MSDFEKIDQLSQEQKENTVLISGTVHPELATEISTKLGIEQIPVETSQHPNTEEYVNILAPVRGKHVVAMQTHAPANGRSSNDALQQHLLLMSAAREASADKITAFSPNVYGARQDKKTPHNREPIAIKLTLQQLALAGADHALFVDIHSEQSLAAFPGVAENIRALEIVLEGVRGRLSADELENLVVAAPDEGRAKTAYRAAKILGAGTEILYKVRSTENSQDVRHVGDSIIPGVEGKTVVIIDDMIDTAGTIMSAFDRLKASGAGDVLAAATHPWLSHPAVDLLASSGFRDIVLADTNPQAAEIKQQFDLDKSAPNFTVVGSGDLCVDALKQIIGNGHLESIYEYEESLEN